MSKFTNAYYVAFTFNDKPLFVGPYDLLEKAEEGYESLVGEENRQIIKVQVVE